MTTRSPWLAVRLGWRNRSYTDASACLAWRNKRIVVGVADEQGDERDEPDAADAHDLERVVGEPVPVEQDAAVLLEGLAVRRQGRVGQRLGHVR